MPPLPRELKERPGIVWLYTCRMAGLGMADLKGMRIDTAEALMELDEFVQDSIYNGKERDKQQSAEDAFWSL